MTTISKQKQAVKADWPVEKIREEMTKVIAGKIITQLRFIEENSAHSVEKFDKLSAQQIAEMLKKNGVRTPLELTKYMAEHQANLFGAKVQYAGDERSATLFNDNPTVWLQAKKLGNMNAKEEKIMQKHFENWNQFLAESFEFTAKVDFANDGSAFTVTFSQ
jgi:hypothetical protein